MTDEPQAVLPQPPYAWGLWLSGLFVTLTVGGFLNIIAGLIAMSTKPAIVSFLIGAVPGAIAIGLAMIRRRSAFAQGVLVAGCIIALIGGICGAGISGTDFK